MQHLSGSFQVQPDGMVNDGRQVDGLWIVAMLNKGIRGDIDSDLYLRSADCSLKTPSICW